MAIILTHCPHCGYAMSADDTSASPIICTNCGKPLEDPQAQTEASSSEPAPTGIQEYLSQAVEAMSADEYLLCLDAVNAALEIDKGNPDALFYQGMATAFLTPDIHTAQVLHTLERAESAIEANAFTDIQTAEQFNAWLPIIGHYLAVKQQEITALAPNGYRSEEDIADMRADLVSLLELCINSIGYMTVPLMECHPPCEYTVQALIHRGESLIAALKDNYQYFDPKSSATLTSHISSSIRSVCSTCAAQLSAIRRSLPSAVAKQEAIRRKQDASRQSVQAFWEAHAEEHAFLQKFVQQNLVGRNLFIVGALLLFAGIVILWGVGLKGLVNAGISQFLYSLCIFGLMVVMITYWILYSLLFKKFDFKNNANTAKRFLASPSGKEQAILRFIEEKQKGAERASSERQRQVTKKILVSSGLIALAALIICSALFYFVFPAIHLNKAEKAIQAGDTLAAITYLNRAGSYGHTQQLLEEQLAPFREKALSYDTRAGAYNNILAVRDAYGDIYYTDFSSGSYPDVAITNAESFLLTQNHIVALRSDGYLSYAQYTTNAGAIAPDISSWSEIVRLGKMNNVIVGYQEDGTLIYNSIELSAETLARLHGDNIVGIYDKFGDIAIRSDGTAALPPAENYSYPEKVQETFAKITNWENLAIIEGDITNHLVGLTNDGRVYAVSGWFDAAYGELNVSSWRNVVDIAAGESHTVGLLADGTVVATGSNSYGQCNVSEWTNIVSIEAGSNFTMGIAADGSVYLTTLKDPVYIARGMQTLCLTEEELAALEQAAAEDTVQDSATEEDVISEPQSSEIMISEPLTASEISQE